MGAYSGFLYGPSGNQIFPTPRESPGKYRQRPRPSRAITKSISQYDHSELVSLAVSLGCRIPALRSAIRDKNSWAFSNWIPIYMGDDEVWGEAAEEYLMNEVLPYALFRELRPDFAWGMKISGMGLDLHGDDLCIFTEDEEHNPKIDIVPSPRIASGEVGRAWVSTISAGDSQRADGLGVVKEGEFIGAGIYNGLIKQGNRWVAARVLGYKDNGDTFYSDIPLDNAAHFASEIEFFGQGRGVPRISASVLHWMNKEEIDDQFLKGLKNAALRSVIHKLPPGQDAVEALGNIVQPSLETVTKADGTTEEQTVYVEYTPDGNVQYIGADEELGGITYENPHPNVEAFAVRVLMECLADLGWSYKLLASDGTSGAPTRLEAQKANNSIWERQSIQEIRSVKFFQHAIAKGMANGRIPKNRNGTDPYKWAVGFPAQITVDSGNDVASALNRLKYGLTNERIEASKDGHIAKHIRRQRQKEVKAIMKAADEAFKFAQLLGHKEFTFQQAMELFYQPNPNSTAQPAAAEPDTDDTKTNPQMKDK